MSSHHIVKDEQEPALLVLHAALLKIEAIAGLLEWSPTIVVPYSQLDVLNSLGCKPDVVLASKNEIASFRHSGISLFDAAILEIESETEVISASLQFLAAGSHSAVNILASPFPGPRPEMNNLPGNIDLVFYHEDARWLWLRQGKYRKWLGAGSPVEIYPGGAGSDFKLSGVGKEEVKLFLKEPATFKAYADGIVSITSPGPFFLKELL